MTTKRIQQTQQGVQIFLTFRKSYTDIDKINLANMVQKVMDEIIGHFFANVYRKIKARDFRDNRDGHLLFEVEMYFKMGCIML